MKARGKRPSTDGPVSAAAALDRRSLLTGLATVGAGVAAIAAEMAKGGGARLPVPLRMEHAHAGLPHWPAFTAEKRATMVFNHRCEVKNDPEGEGRRLIAGAGEGG